MVVAGGGAVAVQVSLNLVNNAVQTEELLPERAEAAEADPEVEGPLNFLVLGVDEQGEGRRSDSTIIVHINAELDDVSIISLPRDLLVDIESCDPACSTKLTEAFSGGGETRADGFANSATTITNLTGIQWDGAMIANFEGFIDLVDELGTIELCPWHEITSIHGEKKTYPEGCADYNRKDALDLVRQRYGWSWDSDWSEGRGGDYGRQKMQQQAIMGILKRSKELGYHKDPAKAVDLLNGFGDKLTVDLGGMRLTDLIVAMRDVDPADMTAIRTPSTTETINGISYVTIPEWSDYAVAADELWEAISDDTIDEWECQYPEYINSDNKPACATEPADSEASPTEQAVG
nr:LCP family protein [Glycomyces sp. L485]